MRLSVALSRAFATAVLVAASGAGAQGEEAPATKEDLGDAPAAPVTPADLGAVEKPAETPPESKKKRTAPAAPAAPAAPVTPSVEQAERAKKLVDDLNAALGAEPGDSQKLEGLALSAVNDGMVQAQPTLRPLLRLARARGLLIQGRLDDVNLVLAEARNAIDQTSGANHKRLQAQLRYRQAELEEVRSFGKGGIGGADHCGLELGLPRLAAFEGRVSRDDTKRVAAKYKIAAQSGEKFWARRAAYRTAALYEAQYRQTLAPAKTLRGVRLPSPYALGGVDSAVLLDDVLKGAWPQEIARMYGELIGGVDAREPDPVLVDMARKRAAELGRLAAPPGETARNPFLADEKAGLLRFNKRFEKRAESGAWVPVNPGAARKQLQAALERGPGGGAGFVEYAYALVALAEAGPAPSPAQVSAALAHTDARMRVAGLVAAERAPDASLKDAILERYFAGSDADRSKVFETLQGALYGEPERALLALRALAAKDRDVAEKLLADDKLPAPERVWIVAEVGDSRLLPRLQPLASDREPVVAARAIFGIYIAQGKNGLGYARPQQEGVVGCVSRAVHEMDASPK